MSKYEEEAAADLKATADKAFAPTINAGRALAAAVKAARESDELVSAMRTTGAMILAAEALQEAAEAAVKDLRAKLSQHMNDSGCTSFETEHQLFYLSRKPAFVSFDDESMIPEEYKIQPPPVWDKKRISAELKAGGLVPGCGLVKPNEMGLAIRARKQEAA